MMPEDWQQKNDEYLSLALSWLRLRLEVQSEPESEQETKTSQDEIDLAPAGQRSDENSEKTAPIASIISEASKTPSSVPSPHRSGWLRRLFASDSSSEETPANSSDGDPGRKDTESLPSEPENPSAGPETSRPHLTREDMAQAAMKMDEAGKVEPPPALIMLSQRLGLSRFEQDLLLLCVAMELDTRIEGLCARAQGNAARPYPTFALGLSLYDNPAWDALSPHRLLRYWQLLEIHQAAAQPLTSSPLRADERIVSFVKGLNYPDDRLSGVLVPLSPSNERSNLPPSQTAAVEEAVHHLGRGAERGRFPIIQLLGSDGQSKQLVAVRTAAKLGLHLYRLPAELLPSLVSELETLARLWQRESLLLPVALYLDAQNIERNSGSEAASAVDRFLGRLSCVVFLDVRENWQFSWGEGVGIEISKPTPEEQKAAWAAALGSDGDGTADLLAGQFNLSLAGINQVIALAGEELSERPLKERLWKGCLALTRPRLDVLAQRIDARAGWDDIVLPSAEENLLHQIADQIRNRSQVYDLWGFRREMNRGLGISALFAGESGTGKTMAAEVIANDLGLSLYRIDLSGVVNKYIGETEKNLRRLFDAAEDGGAILFFDEADALFGRRSEVRDSHDRYANIEINYLLQRIESYSGLAILATNMKSALDSAFLRRLRFVVNFAFPGQVERKLIWQKVFPPETPLQSLDYERLASINLTGGSIHNIALSSAFLAASAGTPVTMHIVLAATRTEMRKLDRPINEADFVWTGGAR
jgi:hypothetical protein